jgi:hypothetical protein
MKRGIALALLVGVLVAPSARAADTAKDVEIAVTREDSATAVSGCKTVHVARTGWDIFHLDVVYKFHHRKSWCWRYPRITWKAVSVYVTNVDPNMEYRGVVSAGSNFYRWCCSKASSGHYSMRQGKFENCILWFPCTRTEYPWVKIWVRANGTWKAETGL